MKFNQCQLKYMEIIFFCSNFYCKRKQAEKFETKIENSDLLSGRDCSVEISKLHDLKIL